ncbi:Transcriptional regulatory protein ZraR [bioreactor metagenome]|uniref:Transcriptional regulatory protein ZraR n=1 Tax=bioreactor metagenome TaxID=1076179 RepID=A0A644WIC1_9ZZZZ
MKSKVKIFLVDDEALFLKLLEIQFLERGDFDIEKFATGEQCIKSLSHKPDVIILDYLLNGVCKKAMNGIETLDKIHAFDSDIPVIILSAQDKIEVAVECMHHKAVDYVVKSETAFFRLQKIISAVFETRKLEKQLNWYMDRM